VAIVLERAGTPQSTAVRLEAYRVTARERGVATLIAQGRTNPEIAEALVLSPYTVQDHIKKLFREDRCLFAPGAGRARVPERLHAQRYGAGTADVDGQLRLTRCGICLVVHRAFSRFFG
jgi:DNA-binding CsgD family transcriptional regulator